ncbi:PAS domain S-box-containing protein/diguanylate cyclase (GGDEF) domain-containing protein [Thermodesulfobium acidiphilum]|uniref:PAS domain S-box-containing protein/diguanylate cyclase (GGDEF) domain-containing protein n=1 Tax=Thermodesulfobium acidiphilum TaxID=1794699 RepID=A0A2R4W195_THEAF|nr:diguanylate cyclase [Thermodesulfobium acidiphilum]AWB10494.1 PAS domain S-box-containing protein/diguanylate cyclase (GGDEF) domain-containing protein [Thermodesulfobium acidiphilum]
MQENNNIPLENKFDTLKNIIDNLDIPILLIDKNHKIILQNKSAFDLFGSKIGGHCWYELWNANFLPKVQREFFEEGKVLPTMQCYFCLSNIELNSKKYLLKELYFKDEYWQLNWISLDKNNMYLIYLINLTRSKEKEKGLKEEKNFLREVIDLVPDMVWLKDSQKRYLLANKAICNKLLHAKNTNEPVGKTDLYFAQRIRAQKPDDPNFHTFGELCMDSDSVVLATKKRGRFEEYGNVAGKYLHLDVIKVPRKNEKGEITAILGAARDVTEQKIAEKQLKETQESLKHSLAYHKILFEKNAAGMLIIDKNFTIIDANPTICKMLLYTKEELINKNINLIHKDDKSIEKCRKLIKKLFRKPNEEITIEQNFKRKDGSTIWIEATSSLIELPNNERAIIWSAIDTTNLYLLKEKLYFQALHDNLTKLPNRRYLSLELVKAIERVKRHDHMLAVCMIDLDDFKPINDTYGHNIGDIVLKTIAQRLTNRLRRVDFVARLGGDEFVILLESIKNPKHLERIFTKIDEAISSPIKIAENITAQVGASMGVYIYQKGDFTTPDDILRFIDIAMYESKKQKGNREHFWKIYSNKNF